MNCISHTGRSPMCAAPAAAPTIAASAIGVSITRAVAEPGLKPFGHLERAAVGADVLAQDEDALVPLHFLPEPLAERLEIGDLRHRVLRYHCGSAWTALARRHVQARWRRRAAARFRRARAAASSSGLDPLVDLPAARSDDAQPLLGEPPDVAVDRIVRAPSARSPRAARRTGCRAPRGPCADRSSARSGVTPSPARARSTAVRVTW